VTPEIVGNELIRLQIDISSSEADLGNSVDGIPGVVRSAAKTSLIVKEGVTATIGGLVKYSQSNADTGVPFLRNIPLLGWVFKSASTQKNNSELLIFITPRIMERADQQTAASGP
jgi:type IV pilus assembly protein PilQ